MKDKVAVNVALTYRLKKHSGGLIPATDWWKLHAKKIEANIRNNQKERLEEEKKVKCGLAFN